MSLYLNVLTKYVNYSFLTGSCVSNRQDILMEAMHSNKNDFTSDRCWSAFTCFINGPQVNDFFCKQLCSDKSCINIVQNTCPEMVFYPSIPVLFGNIYLAYNRNDSQYWTNISIASLYICYNTTDYDHFFINITKLFYNKMTCIHTKRFLPPLNAVYSSRKVIT